MPIKYEVIKNYRKCIRNETVVIFNSYIGACLELDIPSYKIFLYIENKSNLKNEIVQFAANMEIIKEEVDRLLECLVQTGFIKEFEIYEK